MASGHADLVCGRSVRITFADVGHLNWDLSLSDYLVLRLPD